jgi:hypothetical protein
VLSATISDSADKNKKINDKRNQMVYNQKDSVMAVV